MKIITFEGKPKKCKLFKEGFPPLEFFCASIGCIYNFHVAPVRGFFDGATWYLLPSAILGLKLGISIDFRYAKSEKSVVEIIKKYGERGYLIILNEIEHNVVREVLGKDVVENIIKKFEKSF